MSEHPSHARLVRLGLPDIYTTIVGSQKYLRSKYDLDAASIARRILREVNA